MKSELERRFIGIALRGKNAPRPGNMYRTDGSKRTKPAYGARKRRQRRRP